MAAEIKQLARKKSESKVEAAKKASANLRGSIAEVLASDQPSFEHDDMQLMKFHGIYQQEDRDARSFARLTGIQKPTWFMIRMKVPGGAVTPEQYLALDTIADEVTHNHSLRITTRQNIQFHGVLKTSLRHAMQRANDAMVAALCGCGDVARNFMASPAPFADAAHTAARALAGELSEAMCPQTNAYHEVWLDGQKVDSSQEDEPVYGDTYLPRKFKVGIATIDDNSVDVHSQDVGLIAIIEGGKLRALNVTVGGGFGMTHKKVTTYARIGTPLGSVQPDQAIEIITAIAKMFRDYGDRTDRKHARLKYVVEEYGIDAFREEFERRISFKLSPWIDIPDLKHNDHLGTHEQGDGKYFHGVYVDNGRIVDVDHLRMKSAFRDIVERYQPRVIFTPNQNILFGDLDDEALKGVKKILEAYRVPDVSDYTAVWRGSMSCPALPTCGQALTESERVMPAMLEAIEAEFERVGLADEPITIRMTGCPNGCARPYSADIGLVGHKPGHYDIFLGGRLAGDRLAELFAVNVKRDEIAATLRPLLEAWRDQRTAGEGFGEFYNRQFGPSEPRQVLTGDREDPAQQRVLTALTVSA